MFTNIAAMADIAVPAWSVFILAASLLALLFSHRPFAGIPQHWGLQLCWLAWLGIVPALWLQNWAALAVFASAAAFWTQRIFPRRGTSATAARKSFRLASANLAHFNVKLDRALRGVQECDADIIALMEVTPEAREAMNALATSHPYTTDTCDLTALYGVLVRTRWPFDVLSRGAGDDAAPRHLALRLHLPQGDCDLIVAHLTNPLRFDRAHRIPGEIAAVIAMANGGSRDLILCGDCNAAGWSSWLRRLEAATGLRNPGRLHPSWPMWLPPPLRLPIDHAWARGRAVVLETRLGPRTGSDHPPLLAEIGWRADRVGSPR